MTSWTWYRGGPGAAAPSAPALIRPWPPRGRLLGPITCLPRKDGNLPLSALPRTQPSLLACSPHYPYVMSAKQGSCEYHFLKYFGMTRLGE